LEKKTQSDVIFQSTFATKSSKDTIKMASSESQEAEKSRIETSHAEFNALILRHKAMIWHICSDYRLGSAWNTEDCVQEVIMNLWRSFKSFEGRSSEKTWVWRVATNTMLMLRRKDVRSPQTEPIETENEDTKDDEPSNDSYQQLQQLIEALPEESSVVIRAFLDGFSYKEIAEMTNSSVGAVAMRIARLKRKLRKMYERENNL
jgi:RNA polymerase sigma-70 factor (ECF subfamily)